MRRITMVWLATCLLTMGAVAAESEGRFLTGGLINGRGWLAMTDFARVAYISGFYDAMTLVEISEPSGRPEKLKRLQSDLSMKSIEYGEIRKMVDGFYAEAANARIPIFIALLWAKKRVSGATDQELDTMAAKMRANYAVKESAQ